MPSNDEHRRNVMTQLTVSLEQPPFANGNIIQQTGHNEIALDGEFTVVSTVPPNPKQRIDGYNIILTHKGPWRIYDKDINNWKVIS